MVVKDTWSRISSLALFPLWSSVLPGMPSGQHPPLATPWCHEIQLVLGASVDQMAPEGTKSPIKTLHIPLSTLPVAAITQKRKLGREAAAHPARLLPTTPKRVETVTTISHHSLAQCKFYKLNRSQSSNSKVLFLYKALEKVIGCSSPHP